jgi:hypothetical protein
LKLLVLSAFLDTMASSPVELALLRHGLVELEALVGVKLGEPAPVAADQTVLADLGSML